MCVGNVWMNARLSPLELRAAAPVHTNMNWMLRREGKCERSRNKSSSKTKRTLKLRDRPLVPEAYQGWEHVVPSAISIGENGAACTRDLRTPCRWLPWLESLLKQYELSSQGEAQSLDRVADLSANLTPKCWGIPPLLSWQGDRVRPGMAVESQNDQIPRHLLAMGV